MATELGVAYVNILASVRDLESSLAPGLAAVQDQAAGAGDQAGSQFGSAFKVVGLAALAGAAVAMGKLVGDAFGEALNLEKANDKLAAQLGLTGPESAKAGEIAGNLYAGAYGESMDEVNNAVGAVMSSVKGMSTASAADIESLTGKVMDLSATFELDAGRAAQVAGQMITSGLAVDGVHAADLLAASLQKVPAAVREDILDAVDEYAPFMTSLGIEGETAMGLLVNASEKGMFGIDKLGDALKEFTLRSTDMSKATGAVYEAMGLDQQEYSNKLLAGGDTAQSAFADIVHGLQEMEDPASQAAAAIAMFGTPLEDLGVDKIPEFLGQIDPMGDSFDSVAGAAERLGETLNDNAATKIESFKRTLQQGLVGFIGDKVLPALEGIKAMGNDLWAGLTMDPATAASIGAPLEGLVAVGAGIREWIDPLVKTVSDLWAGLTMDEATAASIGAPLEGMVAVGAKVREIFDAVVSSAMPALMDFGHFLKENKTTIEGVTVAVVAGVAAFKTFMMVQAVTTAVKAFSAASTIAAAKQWLLNTAMLANPVGLIIAGIAALVAGLVWFFTQTDTGRAIVEKAWAGIQSAVSVVVDWFQTSVMPVLTKVWDTVSAGAIWLWEHGIKPAWDGIMTAARVVVDWFQNTLVPAVTAVFDKVGAVFTWLYQTIIKPVFDLIAWYVGVWWTIVSGIFQVVVAIVREYLAPVFSWLWETVIKPVFGFIGDLIGAWWGIVSGVFNAVVGFVRDVLAPAFSWLWESVIKPVFAWIGEAASLWWSGMKIIFDAVVGFLRNTFGPAFTWLRDNVITPVWDGIKAVISSVWNDGIKPVFDTISDAVQNKLPAAFEVAKDGIGKAWDKIKDIAKKPVEFVIDKVINEGLIGTFNKIPGVDIAKVSLPPGFKNGGYTGDGPADEIAGPAHRGEFYFTKKQTAAIGKDKLYAMARNAGRGGAAATAGEGNMGGFFEGNAAAIRRHGAYFLDVPGSMSGWNFPGAARMWDGAAGVRVGVGRGSQQGHASPRERGGGILGYTVGNNIDMSPSWMRQLSAVERQTVAAHEMGHALGLPHNGLRSIMQPNLADMASSPTAVDIRNLQSLYPGGSGKAGTPTPENPFNGLVDQMLGQLKAHFPEGGMVIDAVSGVVRTGIEKVTKWVQDIKDGITDLAGDVVSSIRGFFGGGAATAPTLYDNGGVLAPNGGRPQLVQNKTRKPEAIFTPSQLADRDEFMRAAGGRRGSGTETHIHVENMFGSADQIAAEIDTKQRRVLVLNNLKKVTVAA